MNRRTLLFSAAALPAVSFLSSCASLGSNMPQKPVARIDAKTITQLGRTRTDDYWWMKDDNWQEVMRDPSVLRADIREHLVAENAYTEALMAPTRDLQERMIAEMRGRIKEDDSSAPAPDGPWEYYSRFEQGAQYPKYCRRPRGQETGEQVLIDVAVLAQGKAFYKVIAAEHSPDHALLAYAVDEHGSEIYTIYVKDLATGATLPSPAQSAYGDFVWSPNSQYLFWTYRDDNSRPSKIHRRSARGSDDAVIYEETDEGMFISTGATESNAFILISIANQETSETRIIPAADPTASPRVFHPREEKLLYTPTHWNGRWYVLTNAEDAVDFKIMQCAEGATGRAHWNDFIAHEPGRYIEGLGAYKDHLVRLERANALPRITIRNKTGQEHAVAFDEQAFNLDLLGSYEFDTSVMRFAYDSPTTPTRWFDYDMTTRGRTLRKEQIIPSGHDPSAYECRRFNARAPDGAEVPITVLMKRGQALDGSAPMLLYGYGSYGLNVDANFSIRRFSLVDRGWIYAIAHIRGGAEKGFGWFLDGRHLTKKNTFSDFIACAETLIAQNYTRAGKIVAEGRSAGGMLMGAISNMRPELFAGIIGGVPFVDVLNTMSDDSLPLTPPEWPEWGNPLTSIEDYDYIASYSPYDNVETKPYPAMLATGGLTDPRVTYWEPAKWAAKLRAKTTSEKPVILRMNMEAGHAGTAARFDYLKEIAHDYAFAVKAVGDREAGGGF
jgi:oligopeptidase B